MGGTSEALRPYLARALQQLPKARKLREGQLRLAMERAGLEMRLGELERQRRQLHQVLRDQAEEGASPEEVRELGNQLSQLARAMEELNERLANAPVPRELEAA
jgi:flagellar biosynthesis chaperone FliJ